MSRGANHSGHRQRMFLRFMTGGFDGYRPHEILEQLLFEALPRRNTNEIAHDLLDRFGSLAGVLSAEREELKKVRGIGNVSAGFLSDILPRASRALLAQLRGRTPTREVLLVTADFFLRLSAFDSCALLLSGDGTIAGAVCAGAGRTLREIGDEAADPLSETRAAIVLEREENRGAVRSLLDEMGIGIAEGRIYTGEQGLL